MSSQRKITCLVTGSSGYIGQHLINHLLQNEILQEDKNKNRIVGLDRKGNVQAEGWQSFEGDLLDSGLPKLLNEIQPDVVFHTAAAPKTASLEEQLKSTVLGTEHLIKSLAEAQVETRVVVLGSAAEYGIQENSIDETHYPQPESAYGIAKLAQTQTALLTGKHHDIPVMVARIFNVYGYTPPTLAVASLTAQIARMEQRELAFPRIKLFNLLARRDFIHIDDVVRGLVAIAERGQNGEIYNIGSGEAVQFLTLVKKLIEWSRLKDPELVANGEQVDDLSEADITKLINQTGWRPSVSLDNGLQRELEYWREATGVLAV